MKTTIVVLPIALLFAGCAYTPPTSGPKSTVKVVNEIGPQASVFHYQDAATCSDKSLVGKVNPSSEMNISVAAEKRLALRYHTLVSFNGVINGPATCRYCDIIIEFIPEEGKTYNFFAGYDQAQDQCRHTLFDGTQKVEHKMRKLNIPLVDSGP